jgi:hypothetical protein
MAGGCEMTALYILLWILAASAASALVVGFRWYHKEQDWAQPPCGCPICKPEPSNAGSFRARQGKAARRASRREINAMVREIEKAVAE